MQLTDTQITGVSLANLTAHGDDRGVFYEAFRASWLGPEQRWVQWNLSRSHAGVVRGLHYHKKQTDYWVAVEGRLLAGLVDVRRDSPTFRAAICVELDSAHPQGLVIPPGVLHGFRAQTELTLMYLLDQEYDNTDEFAVRWDDPDLRLPANWYAPPAPIISQRDAGAPGFSSLGF